jgi:hypothetical protein
MSKEDFTWRLTDDQIAEIIKTPKLSVIQPNIEEKKIWFWEANRYLLEGWTVGYSTSVPWWREPFGNILEVIRQDAHRKVK